jgi:hypothetical protein
MSAASTVGGRVVARSRSRSYRRATSRTGSRSPPTAKHKDFLETGGVPLNCVFHGGALIITDFGDVTEITTDAPMDGRLWRVDVGVVGMPLFRGAINPRS